MRLIIIGFFPLDLFSGMKISNSNNFTITGKVVKLGESAICNAEKECIDVLITYNNEEIVEIEPNLDLKSFNEECEYLREEEGFVSDKFIS